MHIFYPVSAVREALAWKRSASWDIQGDHNQYVVLPWTSKLPAASLSLVVETGSKTPSVYLVEFDERSGFQNVTLVARSKAGDDWFAVTIGGWKPGTKDAWRSTGNENKSLDTVARSHTDEEVQVVIGHMVGLIAFLQTPRAVLSEPVKGNLLERERQKRATGKAATAWTNVQIRIEARAEAHRDEQASRGAGVALHLRRGHWAWSRTQRETPKGRWLDESHGADSWRGPGWYVFRKETEVGNPDVGGVKVQRHNPQLPGANAANYQFDPSDDMSAERAALLGAAQRNILLRAGYVSSATLH